MKRFASALALSLVIASSAVAAVKRYQVTGEVKEVTADKILVVKKGENFEIARDASSKVSGDVKVGSTVMVEYRMTAATINAKATKAPAKKK